PEDVWSGDGRQFAPDSLTWRNLPLPLMALDTTTEGHSQAVLIGNFDRIERDGSEIHGWGSFISEPDAEAADLIGRITRGELRGVSADVDTVEYEWILPPDSDEGPLLLFADDGEAAPQADPADDEGMVIPMPEPRLRVTVGRVMGATVVPFPAFQECFIEVEAPGLTAGATPAHTTGETDVAWDAAANEANLPSPMSTAQANGFYAWIDSTAVD